MQYINKRRISEAQMLLISTKLTITEISFRCGFNNSNYFQTTFKKLLVLLQDNIEKLVMILIFNYMYRKNQFDYINIVIGLFYICYKINY